jgi:hypothetical protein
MESLTLRTEQTVRLEKLFVFGFPFKEASAPQGHRNTGTNFEQCKPGEASWVFILHFLKHFLGWKFFRTG